MPDTVVANTIAEARTIAASGGPYLVLDASTLQQIEDAEAAGAFERGMAGNADGAPYSATGHSGEQASSASDPAPAVDLSDLDGVRVISIEGAVEKILDVIDVATAKAGEALGPMILVPSRELQKWLNGGASTDDA